MLKNFKFVSLLLLAGALGFSGHVEAKAEAATSISQQSGKVEGTVVDELGPIAGASVVVKGTTNGIMTDMDGKFLLDDVKKGDIIQVSFVGYATQEVTYTGEASMKIVLRESSQALQEVVVTAMGIKRESKTLAYSAQTVGGKELNENKNVNVINSLQGKSAGLQITPNSTGAGGASKILFRGNKSISGSNQPLIVVDGVPLMMNVSTRR